MYMHISEIQFGITYAHPYAEKVTLRDDIRTTTYVAVISATFVEPAAK